MLGDTARSGTLHRWMYDRHSLMNALTLAGFCSARTWDCHTSGIDGWADFYLDANPDGSPYKDFSVYVEAARPSG